MAKTATPKTTPSKETTEKISADSVMIPSAKYTLVLTWKEVEPVYGKAMAKAASRLKMPGFRKGKVPVHLAQPHLDINELIQMTLDEMLSAAYTKLLVENKLQPITMPEIVPLKLEIGSDWELQVGIAEKPDTNIKNYAAITKKARTAAEKELADQKAKAKTDKKAAAVPAPTNSAEADKEFTLKQIFSALATELKPRVPELLVKREAEYELDQLMRSLNQIGLTLEQYIGKRGISREDLTAEVAAASLARLQLEILLEAIAEDQKWTVSDEDAHQHIEKSGHAGHDHTADPEYVRYIKNLIRRQKTIDHLLSV